MYVYNSCPELVWSLFSRMHTESDNNLLIHVKFVRFNVMYWYLIDVRSFYGGVGVHTSFWETNTLLLL